MPLQRNTTRGGGGVDKIVVKKQAGTGFEDLQRAGNYVSEY